jgi:hypothetical protein
MLRVPAIPMSTALVKIDLQACADGVMAAKNHLN